MSSGGVTMENANHPNEGNKRLCCSFYGCKRVYTDANSLQSHIKDHDIPAQSLPGKRLMCSVMSCGCSFPNMQKLMEHQRHHHKPNVFFLCESCHAKLRSYRGLLHHLRSCSKAPKPKINVAPSPASSSTPPAPMDVDPAQTTAPPQDNLSLPPQPQLPPVLTQSNNTPAVSPNVDLAPPHLIQQIIDSTVNAMFSNERSQVFPNLENQTPANPHEVQIQQRLATPDNSEPHTISPQTPPTNIWRSSKDAPEKRMLWQHTRGRYMCVQCGYTVSNRKEMTEHSTYHDLLRPKEETTNPATPST